MPTDPDMRPIASSAQIQGNILAPFRCDYQAFLVLGFRHERDGARRWLGTSAGQVSSTDDVRGAKRTSFKNLGLTATGLVTLHPDVAADLVQFEAFWNGPLGNRLDESGALTTTAALLGDVDVSDPTSWLVGGPDRPPVDAVLTLAATDRTTLDSAVSQEQENAKAAGLDVVLVQEGQVLRNDDRHSIDHFGFADGISQPGIRGFSDEVPDSDRLHISQHPGSPIIAPGEFLLGYPGERRTPTRTPRPSPAPWMRGGSFQVFRRLRQDVAGWRQRMAALSGYGSGREDVEAKAIGRRPDGRPLVPAAGSNNDFDYRDDPQGWYTPFYAHIRKMNPRNDKVFRDRSRKLLRRGVPFEQSDPDRPGEVEKGLLFNAYMASIEDQFEFLQRRWANDPEFPASTLARFQQAAGTGRTISGLDPVVGDDAQVARRRFGKRIVRDIPPPALGGFVTTTGAVYAFAPSIPALTWLAGQDEI
jgi:Dyp-type peroxidase family